MKGHFLEQILKGEFSSNEEIIKRGSFMGFDFRTPYRIAAIEYVKKGTKTQSNDPNITTVRNNHEIYGYPRL